MLNRPLFYLKLICIVGVVELLFDVVDVFQHKKVFLHIFGDEELDIFLLLQVNQEQPEDVERIELQFDVLVFELTKKRFTFNFEGFLLHHQHFAEENRKGLSYLGLNFGV